MNETAFFDYIFPRLASPIGQNIALIAPANGGKTELLRQIGQPNIYTGRLPETSHWFFNYLAADQFQADSTAVDFWQQVWSGFAQQAIGQDWQTLLEQIVNRPRAQYSRTLRQLDKQQVRLVLLLDDLDRLAEHPNLFTQNLAMPLRALSSRYSSFTVVFSSRLRLRELNHKFIASGSPPFNHFNEILLREFADQ